MELLDYGPHSEPKVLMSFAKANEYAVGLNATDEDGWSYKVVTFPENGLSYIAVYDDEGVFLGPL